MRSRKFLPAYVRSVSTLLAQVSGSDLAATVETNPAEAISQHALGLMRCRALQLSSCLVVHTQHGPRARRVGTTN